MKPVLYMIIPCYNEEKVLPVTAPLFFQELQYLIRKEKIGESSRILFINDGSRDGTWGLIEKMTEREPHILGLDLSRNRGHQNAVFAGLMEAREQCDITITIDCDGQDDIQAMEAMVNLMKKAVRSFTGCAAAGRRIRPLRGEPLRHITVFCIFWERRWFTTMRTTALPLPECFGSWQVTER